MTGSCILEWPRCKAWAGPDSPKRASPSSNRSWSAPSRCLPIPVANALVRCFTDHCEALLPYLRRSQGESRELLARVASELATPAMADEMILLAADPRPEVRAAAAKALAVAPLALALPTLGDLARDEIWFVRLRAITALNQISHPRIIPILLDAVRDANRLVRMRAASALAKFDQDTVEILQNVADSRDRYALHAMISALELGGGFEKVMAELSDPMLHDATASAIAGRFARRRCRNLDHAPRRSCGGIRVSVTTIVRFSPGSRSGGVRLFELVLHVLRLNRDRLKPILLALGAQVDAKLLAFLVEVAAFEAQCAGYVGHVMVVAAQLGEENFFLERFHAFGQRTGCRAQHRLAVALSGKASFISSAVMASLVESSSTRSTTFRNSRTLPGHA